MTHAPATEEKRRALDALRIRVATAGHLVIACQQDLSDSISDPYEVDHLKRVAVAVWAHAAVWLGEDPALLAEEAREVAEDERHDADDQEIDPRECYRPGENFSDMAGFLTHQGDVPAPRDHDQARLLCLNILACLMHAEYAADGTEWEIYDSHEPFAF